MVDVDGVDEVEEPPNPWLKVLPFMEQHSDDPDVLVRSLYTRQTNLDDGYLVHEVMLTFTTHHMGLGPEWQNLDTSGYQRRGYWRGLSFHLGPFSLTASRERGTW